MFVHVCVRCICLVFLGHVLEGYYRRVCARNTSTGTTRSRADQSMFFAAAPPRVTVCPAVASDDLKKCIWCRWQVGHARLEAVVAHTPSPIVRIQVAVTVDPLLDLNECSHAVVLACIAGGWWSVNVHKACAQSQSL